VLEFLVTSKARRRLLRLLWSERAVGSAPDLAVRAGVTSPSAYAELRAMKRIGLATTQRVDGAELYAANLEHPQAEHLLALLAAPTRAPATEATDRELRLQLRDLGAPLAVDGQAPPAESLEAVLADGLELAHRDASVARTLPVCLWKQRDQLRADVLQEEARERGEKQTLGFFLELTSDLSGDPRFRQWAKAVRDERVSRTSDFFYNATSRDAQLLAESRTPRVARRWHFRMNMDEETFRSHFDKFVHEDLSA
jgi:hypothetical protein